MRLGTPIITIIPLLIRGERIRDFLDFYRSLGNSLSEEEKALLKHVAGDSLVFKNGNDIFLEIK